MELKVCAMNSNVLKGIEKDKKPNKFVIILKQK